MKFTPKFLSRVTSGGINGEMMKDVIKPLTPEGSLYKKIIGHALPTMIMGVVTHFKRKGHLVKDDLGFYYSLQLTVFKYRFEILQCRSYAILVPAIMQLQI